MNLPVNAEPREGQSGLLTWLKTVARTLNGLAGSGNGDMATWDGAAGSLKPITRAALAADPALTGAFATAAQGAKADTAVQPAGLLYPYMAQIVPAGPAIAVSGTWEVVEDPNARFRSYFLQSSVPSVNDEIAWDVLLAAGTYRLNVVHLTGDNQGIYDILIDGTAIATIDAYSASGIYNVKTQVTGIVVATAGRKRVSLRVTGKNGSSSSRYAQPSSIQLIRTGA